MTYGELVRKIHAMPTSDLQGFTEAVAGSYFKEWRWDGKLDPEREVNGGDLVDDVGGLLRDYGLWPEEGRP